MVYKTNFPLRYFYHTCKTHATISTFREIHIGKEFFGTAFFVAIKPQDVWNGERKSLV
jgi:hypothetical protein